MKQGSNEMPPNNVFEASSYLLLAKNTQFAENCPKRIEIEKIQKS